eukprot:scaffold68458_cov17-Tisochrysis_lutea.AAC.2
MKSAPGLKPCELKEKQIGTLFVWLGTLGGGYGARVVSLGFQPKIHTCLPTEMNAGHSAAAQGTQGLLSAFPLRANELLSNVLPGPVAIHG